ncbi:MAG: hypothetical protein IT569_02890 [Leptospiraceae bacterium]|nr:hypothetical protein [Leptospiraceae bacterium]
MLKKKPFVGILAFCIVLLLMPLGHTSMILMEKLFGSKYVFHAALFLGFLGIFLLIRGIRAKSEMKATILGLFSGLFFWTGWIEFSFVYFSNRFGVEALKENGEVVTKPEYLIMPSSIGFLAFVMIYYTFGIRTGCPFFTWIQKKLNLNSWFGIQRENKNIALVTFLEFITILWAFYLLLLFAYDKNFFGDRHPFTFIIAIGSLAWSIYLFFNLIKISQMNYAVRYAIPTVIIFWNFVEVLGRWNFISEIWLKPKEYAFEMSLTFAILVVGTIFSLFATRKPQNER